MGFAQSATDFPAASVRLRVRFFILTIVLKLDHLICATLGSFAIQTAT
jgi:hypothetical protein